jgi:hypothetical protein
MTAYRCYFLDENGKINGVDIVERETDAAAVEEAQRRRDNSGYPKIEVWDRARLVGIVGDGQAWEITRQEREASTNPASPRSETVAAS